MGKPVYASAAFFLVVALLCIPVSAGDITFQTPYSSYTFENGEEAKIPVIVTNGIGKDIKGTLIGKFAVFSDEKNSRASTYSKQQIFTVFSDMEGFNYIIGTENEPETIYADIIFEFTADKIYRICLEDIKITFTDSPLEEENTGDEISAIQDETITDTNGLKEQKNNPAVPYDNSGLTGDLSTGIRQENADTEGLKESAETERELIKELKESLLTKIFSDEIFACVNDSLQSQSFRDGIISVMPKDMNSGAFYLEYRSKSADIVMVSGEVEEGRISYIRQESNFSIMLPPALLQNETFIEYDGLLAEKNYKRDFSSINSTRNSIEFDLSYEAGKNPAVITAIIQNNNLTEVALLRDSGILLYAAAILIIIASGIIAAASYCYLLKKPENEDLKIIKSISPPSSESPQDMLCEAVRLYNSGKKKEALHKVTQSLRKFISKNYGTGDEITDIQCLKITLKDDFLNKKCKMILSKTDQVRFAGETELTITTKEFLEIAESVREIIENSAK